MDIVLEFTDTFIADYAYAFFFPKRIAPYDFPLRNGTAQTYSGWTFKPASQYISFNPSQAAYDSEWDRDNIWRQMITLYFITWYITFPRCPTVDEAMLTPALPKQVLWTHRLLRRCRPFLRLHLR